MHVLIAVSAAIAAWSMPAAVAHAAFPGTNGKLAFVSARSGYPADSDLYTTANNVETRITNLNLDELNPSWSPSGNEIVFERNAGLRSDIWIANADGSSARRLTTNPGNDSRPAFSNAGTRIVYASDRSGTGISGMSDIFVMDTNGGNQVNITNTPTVDENYPSWSPDGTAIAFSRDGDIYKASPTGANLTRLTSSPLTELEPDWSPTSSQIVFTQGNDGDHELWKINANGSGVPVHLTQNADVVEERPVWSPEGDKIAFIRGAFDEAEIYTMNADGSGVTRITTNAFMDASPSWQVVPAVPAPDTVISATPPAQTQSTSARFEFGSDQVGATFRCRLDGAAPVLCTSPRDYANLALGQHSFEVTAVGPTGIADPSPASWSWQVVQTLPPPDTVISAAPPAQTQSTSVQFEFDADQDGATFRCRLDGAAPAPCASPRDYANLAVGQHSFEVTAVGPTGTADPVPASWSWTVNAPPPPPPPTGTGTVTGTPASPPAVVTDKAAPRARLAYAKGQRASKLAVVVRVNEAGTVTGRGSVAVPGGASKRYKFKSVSRSVKANGKVKLRLKLRGKALKAIKRALRRKVLTAKITITAKDRSGNKKTSTVRIKLRP
jgi:Tol biopolymer transport system component